MGVRSGCWAPVQLRGPRQEGSRPSVCWVGGGVVIAARGWVCPAPLGTPGVRVGRECWRTQPGGGGKGERSGRPAPSRGLDPRTVAACFPKTGGGSGRRRGGGARREGFHSSVSPTPTPFLRRGAGHPARRPGRGGGVQTKGACAFKAGSPGAGGEGTSGSGVEGGCAGQQGRGRGPGGLRTAGGAAGTRGHGAGPRDGRPAGRSPRLRRGGGPGEAPTPAGR